MKNQQPKDIMYKKIEWTIKGFSKLKPEFLYSQVFTFGNTAWKLNIYPKGDYTDVGYLSIYLDVADPASLPKGWSIYAEYRVTLVNQDSRKSSVKRDYKDLFCAEKTYWGRYYIPFSRLHDPNSGFILNDTCIIEIEWFVLKSEGISRDLFDEDKFIDFKGLGQIERTFVPLLEEVCLWHPSLMECQKKRTRRFTEWAFTALGRVLHFLKTKKRREMTESEDACEQLKHLWAELETCRFDLTWLEPHVQSALGMKKAYVEKPKQVKKLKETLVSYETEMKKLTENLVALKTETEQLREKLVNIEENVEKVSKDLGKAQEGFEERDMNAELGYAKGKP